MEDDWTEYYENINNLENYYDEFDFQKHRYGFVSRKFEFWKKYFIQLKKMIPNIGNFFIKQNLMQMCMLSINCRIKKKNLFLIKLKH